MMKSRIIFFSCVYVPGVHVCLLGGVGALYVWKPQTDARIFPITFRIIHRGRISQRYVGLLASFRLVSHLAVGIPSFAFRVRITGGCMGPEEPDFGLHWHSRHCPVSNLLGIVTVFLI